MENKKELKTRRQFFKKAAMGALPILGAIVLTQVPVAVNATTTSMGCNSGCEGGCTSGCNGCSGCTGCDTTVTSGCS